MFVWRHGQVTPTIYRRRAATNGVRNSAPSKTNTLRRQKQEAQLSLSNRETRYAVKISSNTTQLQSIMHALVLLCINHHPTFEVPI